MIGMIVGLIRMVLDFLFTEPPCGFDDTRPEFIKKVKQLLNKKKFSDFLVKN